MRARIGLGAATVVTVAALGLAFVHPFGNPRKVAAAPRSELLHGAAMPLAARNVLVTKCADCHSNATDWPVYTRVAPISWLTERDVAEGRGHLNLSHWAELPESEREVLATEIAGQAKKGSMPLLPYRLIHHGSTLTKEDVAALVALAPADADTGEAAPGDATRGRALFERRCTGCHSLDANREGPMLRGVYGRKAASVRGFDYTPALRGSGLTWTDATLDHWLRDSDEMVPQSGMGFAVPKAQDRGDLVAFLKGQR